MISYHLTPANASTPWAFARGFKDARIDDLSRIARGISKYVWSPCIWRDGHRLQANFICAEWCVLDFDNGEMSLEQALNSFCDTVHIIGTTKSHGVDKGDGVRDRFRVAIKLDRVITDLRDYRFTMSQAIRRYPVDPSPKDGARFFFPCKEIVSISNDGYHEEALTAPDGFERPNMARFEGYRKAGVMPPRARAALSAPVSTGERNTTWYCIAKDLTRIGMSPDEITARIVASPTYQGSVSHDLRREIECCVENGLKAVLREEQNGERRSEIPGARQDPEDCRPQE